ncbi:hypothetical protein SAMN05443247_00014 [Bradyrhizobium erythrophlei]|jgi:hypothetical protein|nr:hypothetical protein SAMN05443247_00014 [Bradyrhizobium erythrophlei]
MKGRKPNITPLHGALDKAPPAPAWLPKFSPRPGGKDFPKMGNLLPAPSDRSDTRMAFAEHDDGQTKRLRYCEEAVSMACGPRTREPTIGKRLTGKELNGPDTQLTFAGRCPILFNNTGVPNPLVAFRPRWRQQSTVRDR